jgi:hypothetical protein
MSADFAGTAEQLEFRWKWEDPVGGLPPNLPYEEWNT